jgi:hypothetical protein
MLQSAITCQAASCRLAAGKLQAAGQCAVCFNGQVKAVRGGTGVHFFTSLL